LSTWLTVTRKDGVMISRESAFGNHQDTLSQPAVIRRRTLLGSMGGALVALLASPHRGMADDEHAPNNPFIVLLHGIYQPVPIGEGPADNLGLKTVDLSDGFYSKTQIYPIFGVDGSNDQKKAIGTFFVEATLEKGQITFNPPANPGFLCAYDLPGGAIA